MMKEFGSQSGALEGEVSQINAISFTQRQTKSKILAQTSGPDNIKIKGDQNWVINQLTRD